MCGRYASAKDPDALVEEFEVEESLVDKPLQPDYNVAPTKSVYAVLSRHPEGAPDVSVVERQLRVVRWGLVPSWAKDRSIGSRMINARAETVAEKPAFRRAFSKRRCLLPADGYYEWYTPTGNNVPMTSRGKPVKQPFYIHRSDGHSLAMAGLYEWWHDKSLERDDPKAWLLTATIITTSATDAVGRIHDRMPVVVGAADWERWLDPAVGDREIVESLMTPAQSEPLAAYPVSVRVNSVRNNGPELIEPLPLEEVAPGSVGADGLWPPDDA
jgi:putative SOS response-associated peptidase YedK